MKKFLTAEWRDLIMANYEVDRSLLASRLPGGTQLDLHEGRCFVSLVAFMFLDTRVMDILVPLHVNFEEVNLRFYVTREVNGETRRGVVFIKEIVPRTAIAWIARTVYGEPYERWTMSNERTNGRAAYSWKKGTCENALSVSHGANIGIPAEGSHGEFIIEHYWGYTKRDGHTDEYKVEHPKWDLFETSDVNIDVDFRGTYGDEFGFLANASPYSLLFANGSNVSVYKGNRIL